MLKRTLGVILSLVVIGSAFTGCGKKEEPKTATDSQKKVKLTIMYAGGDPAWKQTVADSIDSFTKANPNITVDQQPSGSGAYLDFIKTKDAVGEFPDVIEMRDAPQFVKANKLAVLPDELVNLIETPVKHDGKYYILPTGTSSHGIIYNKKIFKDNNLSEPKTYDEFLQLADKIKAKGIAPLVVGGKDIWHMGFLMNHFMRNEVFSKNVNWQKDRLAGKVKWTDAEPTKAVQGIVDLFKKGYVQEGFISTPDNQTATILVSGKAAMLYSGPWMFSQIAQADPNFEIGFFYLPDNNSKVNMFAVPTGGWSLSAKAAEDPDKKEAAYKFMKYFFSKEVYTKVNKDMNQLPTTKEKITYDSIPAQQVLLKGFSDPKNVQIPVQMGDADTPAGFRNYMYKVVQEVILGAYGVDEAMKKLDVEWDKAVAASKQ